MKWVIVYIMFFGPAGHQPVIAFDSLEDCNKAAERVHASSRIRVRTACKTVEAGGI